MGDHHWSSFSGTVSDLCTPLPAYAYLHRALKLISSVTCPTRRRTLRTQSIRSNHHPPSGPSLGQSEETQGYEGGDEGSSLDEQERTSDSASHPDIDDLRTSPIPVPSQWTDDGESWSPSPSQRANLPSPVRRFYETFDDRDDYGNPITRGVDSRAQ